MLPPDDCPAQRESLCGIDSIGAEPIAKAKSQLIEKCLISEPIANSTTSARAYELSSRGMNPFSPDGYLLITFTTDSRPMSIFREICSTPHSRTNLALRAVSPTALLVSMLVWIPIACAAHSGARPATKSERSAIIAAFTASDGNATEVHGVFVSRSNAGLAVVCTRTPEAGTLSYVFHRAGRAWRYLTSGPVGKTGNSAQRALERACG